MLHERNIFLDLDVVRVQHSDMSDANYDGYDAARDEAEEHQDLTCDECGSMYIRIRVCIRCDARLCADCFKECLCGESETVHAAAQS